MTERRLEGVGVTPKAGVGTARWVATGSPALGEPPDPGTVDPETERARFETARDAVRERLRADRDRAAESMGEDEASVFDAHVAFLDDPELETAVHSSIEEGLPAEHAVRAAFGGFIEQFERTGGRTAERADDLRDVRDRLVGELVGDEPDGELPSGSVVLATRLTPSDTAALDPERVAGIATVAGGRTAHAAIMARSLGLPAVVGVGEALEGIEDGERVAVDGAAGVVVVDPSTETLSALPTENVEVRSAPVETADGRPVEVAANVGSAAEATAAVERGADGIGLFRTEFLFLDREAPPDEDEQFDAYTAALDSFPDARVVVRTLDVGGDKEVPYLDLDPEENGFLGARGLRLSLDEHAGLFETQLRALLRANAAGEGDLAVMFPMVSTVGELEAAIARVEEVAEALAEEGLEYERPELGAMVETPAAALTADALARRVEFLSIGTNDLAGYVMAAARDLDRVEALSDPLEPAVLRAIDATVRAAHEEGAWVGMCGEMAGDPALSALLLGLGLDELSMAGVAVPRVKARVLETDTAEAEAVAERALDAETPEAVRALLEGE